MSMNSVQSYQRDFTYDQYGCIQQVDDNGTTISSYGYSLEPFHAPDTYNGDTLVYDENGNLIEDEDFTYVYNDANQMSEVHYAGNDSLVEKYWYDANGQRIKKQDSNGEFTYYVNKFYEVDNGVSTSYFFRDDERIAKDSSEGMEWYLSDHLGSTTLLVNESGLEVERTEYYPYGEVQSGGLEKYGFTGQENDADTELMYYGARYYSPEYRIFVQPDTMLPSLYNPQALNRYAYTLNNPVKYTDPSGHFADELLDAGFIVMDLIDIYSDPSNKWAWASLGLDVGCVLLPFVTGGRVAVKGMETASKANKVAETVHSVKVIDNGVSLLTKYGDDTAEALAKISADVESQGIIKANPMLTGTVKHTAFKREGKEWAMEAGKTNIYFEKSINDMGQLVSGNPSGSVRPDVMEIGEGGIVRIYDLKTGGAQLTNSWMNKVQTNLFNNNAYNTIEFYMVKNGETTLVKTVTNGV